MKKIAMSLMVLGLLGSFAGADLLTIVGPTPANNMGTDIVLYDCYIDTGGADWLSGLFYCELSAGSLYQDSIISPSMPWGYVANVNDNDSWLPANVTVFGDANELASVPGMSGDPANAEASITFIASLPSDPVPAWNGLAARFAFTPDAVGTWAFQVSAKGSDAVLYVGTIPIPEPGTVTLLLCGLVGFCVLRQR